MSTKLITGRCLCGSIRYQMTGETVWTGYCHCESCRRFTGSVVTNWLGVKDTDLAFIQGKPRIHEATPGVRRGFCPDCGSSLTYEARHFPDYIQIHLGTLDNPDDFKPLAHVHCAEKIAWFAVDDELPRYSGSAADEGNGWDHSGD